MGLRLGQLFFLAISLDMPARIKINAKSHMLAHLIFLVITSFCGIRRLLILVIRPPKTITIGNIQGVLNSRKVATVEIAMIIWVMVLWMEIRKAFHAAYARNPTVIGSTKRNRSALPFL